MYNVVKTPLSQCMWNKSECCDNGVFLPHTHTHTHMHTVCISSIQKAQLSMFHIFTHWKKQSQFLDRLHSNKNKTKDSTPYMGHLNWFKS